MSEDEATRRVQSSEQVYDHNVDGPTDPDELNKLKLTGNAAPGSHSALFGLTPDGKVHTETSSNTTAPRPAHSKAAAIGGGRQTTSDGETGNTSSTAAAGAGVAAQIHDPRVAQRARGRDADELTGAPGDNPGAGIGADLGAQGSGKIGGQEGGGSLLDTVKSYLPGSS